MPVSTECAATLLSFRYPSTYVFCGKPCAIYLRAAEGKEKNILDLNCTFFIDILLDCEFKDRRDGWFWCQTLTTETTWLCLSNQKGELTWSHSLLIAGFVVHASEWSEFLYTARMLEAKELLLIDFPRRKIHPFWLTENIIMGNSTRDNEIMNFFK